MPALTDRNDLSDNVARHIHTFIAEDLLMGQGVEFDGDDLLLEAGIIDSLGLLDLVNFIETEFGISVDDVDVTLDNFGSVNTIASYVASQRAKT